MSSSAVGSSDDRFAAAGRGLAVEAGLRITRSAITPTMNTINTPSVLRLTIAESFLNRR
jgi:hypothetical protein